MSVLKNRDPDGRELVRDNDGRVKGSYQCLRCSMTGRFITYVENGIPRGPGGDCYRCDGKGHHDQADRRRNYGADMHMVVRH